MTVIELIHAFCNKNFKKEDKYYTSGNYGADKNEFYVGTRLKAYHYGKNIIIEDFNRDSSGGYGGSYGGHTVLNASPNKDKAFLYNKLLTEEIINDEAKFIKWYQNEFVEHNRRELEAISSIKDFIKSTKYKHGWSIDALGAGINYIELPDDVNKKYKKIINKILITVDVWGKYYSGWSKHNCLETVKINHTVKQLVNFKPTLFFTKEELKIYEFKVWREKYVISPISKHFIYDLKKSREIYNDLEGRKQFEIRREEEVELLKKIKEERARIERLKDLKQKFKSFVSWKEGNSPYDSFSIGFQGLRIVKTDVDKIQTSFGVSVRELEARNALAFFRRYKDSETDIEIKFLSKLLIAGFPIKGIFKKKLDIVKDDQIVEIEAKCLVIGCHTIPDFEIEDFLQRYNLNW